MLDWLCCKQTWSKKTAEKEYDRAFFKPQERPREEDFGFGKSMVGKPRKKRIEWSGLQKFSYSRLAVTDKRRFEY